MLLLEGSSGAIRQDANDIESYRVPVVELSFAGGFPGAISCPPRPCFSSRLLMAVLGIAFTRALLEWSQ